MYQSITIQNVTYVPQCLDKSLVLQSKQKTDPICLKPCISFSDRFSVPSKEEMKKNSHEDNQSYSSNVIKI